MKMSAQSRCFVKMGEILVYNNYSLKTPTVSQGIYSEEGG